MRSKSFGFLCEHRSPLRSKAATFTKTSSVTVFDVLLAACALAMLSAVARALDTEITYTYIFETALPSLGHSIGDGAISITAALPVLSAPLLSPPTNLDRPEGVAEPAGIDLENERLSAAEFLAAVVHEISQPISAILSHTAAAQNWLKQNPPAVGKARQELQSVNACSTHAFEILRGLQALARAGIIGLGDIDLNEVIAKAVELSGVREKIGGENVKLDLDPALPQLMGSRLELELLFLNLFRNAIEAMERSGRRKLVSVRTFPIGRRYVGAIVKDTGGGIAKGDIQAVFSPFFSRKQGSLGIGLSLCRRIAEAHSGSLRARSLGGTGACFELRIPCR